MTLPNNQSELKLKTHVKRPQHVNMTSLLIPGTDEGLSTLCASRLAACIILLYTQQLILVHAILCKETH